jgi:hypothetical protein
MVHPALHLGIREERSLSRRDRVVVWINIFIVCRLIRTAAGNDVTVKW